MKSKEQKRKVKVTEPKKKTVRAKKDQPKPLRESDFSLALLVGKVGVWELNLGSASIDWSPRACDLLGLQQRESLSYDAFRELVHPDDRAGLALELDQAIKDKRDFSREFRLMLGKQVRWLRCDGRPCFTQEGEPERVVGTTMDITDARAETMQRQELIDTLTRERAIRERFVNALTHDLRTPLTAARMSGQLIARYAHQPDRVLRLATRVVDNVDRANDMITDLLDSSRIREGLPLYVEMEACEIRKILVATLEELTLIHGNRFSLSEGGEVRGFWDGKAIRRIVENLCHNAVKYGSRHAPVHVEYEKEDDQLLLSVANAGENLSAEEVDNLFRWFTRSEKASAGSEQGWGIGLTVVKGITEAHGGKVEVQSSDGVTIFLVRLPVDARPVSPNGN